MSALALILGLAVAPAATGQDAMCLGPAITLTATSSPEPSAPGKEWAVALRVENTDSHDADNVIIKGDVPFNTTFVSIREPREWHCQAPTPGTDGTITCTANTLGAKAAATLWVTFAINLRTPPDVEITASFAVLTRVN